MQCAICDGTNVHMRLCDTCRADPANGDWSEVDEAYLAADVDEVNPAARLADLQDDPVQLATPLQRTIIRLLCNHTIRRPWDRRRRYERRPRWGWRSDALTYDEIAHLAGCDESYVRRVVHVVVGATMRHQSESSLKVAG